MKEGIKLKEKYTWSQDKAEVEIGSNYGTWDEALQRFNEDDEKPIIFLKTVYEDMGDTYESVQGLTYDQANFIMNTLCKVVNEIYDEVIER